MNNHELEFKKATNLLKGVRLSDAEKNTMLSNIYREAVAPSTAIPSPFSLATFFQSHRYASAFAAVVLLMGGTAHASFESLPGDPLYGIKINVIEPVALAVRLEETAKNEYRVAVLQERVEEIQKLKTEGRLSFDVETISAVAAGENLAQIEASPMFTATGTNLEVSGYVETYNSLVEETHRLKTIIHADSKDDGEKGHGVESPTKTAKEKPGDVEGTLTDTLDVMTEVVDPEETEKVLDLVVPTINDIEL